MGWWGGTSAFCQLVMLRCALGWTGDSGAFHSHTQHFTVLSIALQEACATTAETACMMRITALPPSATG